jgi:hypothetical protein
MLVNQTHPIQPGEQNIIYPMKSRAKKKKLKKDDFPSK